MQDPKTIVQEFYAAFARGDVESIVKGLHPHVAWEAWTVDNYAQKARVPWLQPHNTRESVREFFSILGGFTWIDFRVLSLMSGGNQVAAEVHAEWKSPSGFHVKEEEMHLWTLNDQGQIVRFRHYLDTAKHIAAAGVG